MCFLNDRQASTYLNGACGGVLSGLIFNKVSVCSFKMSDIDTIVTACILLCTENIRGNARIISFKTLAINELKPYN